MNQQGGSSFPVGKVLIGCGCFSLIALVIVVVAIFGGGFFLFKAAEDSGVTEIVKNLDDAQHDGGKSLKKKAMEKGKKEAMDIDGDQLLEWPGTPLTREDVKQHVAFMKQWEGSSFVKEARENQATLQELSKKKKSEKNLKGKKMMMRHHSQ